MLQWHHALRQCSAGGAARSGARCAAEREDEVLTFKDWLHFLRSAKALLLSHLESLFGACVRAKVDLEEVLTESSERLINLETLETLLKKSGVAVETANLPLVFEALNAAGSQRIFIPELVRGFQVFRQRFSKLIGGLAQRLGEGGGVSSSCSSFGGLSLRAAQKLTVEELFERASKRVGARK